MSEYLDTFNFFKTNSIRHSHVQTESDVKSFLKSSSVFNWIYLIKFSNDIYAWGTASKNGSRLRKTSLFNRKLTGKYDRRGDYLMLIAVYGQPEVTLFEIPNAVGIEQERRRTLYGSDRLGACFRGFSKDDRTSITLEVYELFKSSSLYNALTETERKIFDEFIYSYYLGKLKHPHRNATFYFGDCLEPNFLDKTLGRSDFIPVIEKALDVKF